VHLTRRFIYCSIMKKYLQAIIFWFFYPVLRIFTWMPLRLQYLFADVLYFLMLVSGYRKKVIRNNLKNALPEKSEKERKSIERKFYRHLADSLLESVAQMGFSREELARRFRFKNPELINRYAREGKSVLLATAHYANWEWFASFPPISPFRVLAIYKPLRNPFMDRLFVKIRERTGAIACPMEEVVRKIYFFRDKNIPTLTYFIVDQRPLRKSIGYWDIFLHQETPFYLGIEKIARKTGFPVFFMKVDKVARGYYEAEFILLEEEPAQTKPYEITRRHIRLLEEIIREKPELWLWSHRRWKHKRLAEEILPD